MSEAEAEASERARLARKAQEDAIDARGMRRVKIGMALFFAGWVLVAVLYWQEIILMPGVKILSIAHSVAAFGIVAWGMLTAVSERQRLDRGDAPVRRARN